MIKKPYPILLMMSEVLAFGGAENFFYLLVKHLDPALFACRVIVPREGALTDRIREPGLSLEVRPLRDPWNIHQLPWFVHYLKTHHIRLINAHGVRAGFYASLARRRLPVKVVVTEHNMQIWRNRFFPRMIDRFIAHNNDKRITVSKAVADAMVASGVCGPEMIQVIHVAVETDRFNVDPAIRESERRHLGIAPNEFAVVSAGRLHKMKGFIYLAKAAPKILEHVPNAKIIIAGEGEEKGSIKQEIEALRVGDRVWLPGYVENMPGLLAAADVFVLPSVEEIGCPREGLPMVIAEAMASGCPVVSTSVSGNKEIVRHEYNGMIVPQCDPVKLAEGITRILMDPDRKRYGENGRRTVEERFCIENVAEQYSQLYLDLIEYNTFAF